MGISEKIKAIYVLQRFVRMSRVLIPTYIELSNKSSLTDSESFRVKKIESIYNTFKADPVTSQYLINSNILGLIQGVYASLQSERRDTPEGFHEYNSFIHESDRLIGQWDRQILN
ncbi:MAG: hypothetical protein ACI857_001758 [Arenicella sp.]|jgi:hypothetical protein